MPDVSAQAATRTTRGQRTRSRYRQHQQQRRRRFPLFEDGRMTRQTFTFPLALSVNPADPL